MDVLEERAVAEDTLEARGWLRISPSEGSGGGPAMEVDIEEVRQEALARSSADMTVQWCYRGGAAKLDVHSTEDLALFKPREEEKEAKKKEAEEKRKRSRKKADSREEQEMRREKVS